MSKRQSSDVRERVGAGHDARPREIADAIGASRSGFYGWISKGQVEVRRLNGILVVPNREARRLLGMQEASAA